MAQITSGTEAFARFLDDEFVDWAAAKTAAYNAEPTAAEAAAIMDAEAVREQGFDAWS